MFTLSMYMYHQCDFEHGKNYVPTIISCSTNQYMGFGLSGSASQTLMFGADPTITWVDTMSGEANAVDYHLSAYTQVSV